MIYFTPFERIVIEGNVDLQQKVLRLCTGHSPVNSIMQELSRDVDPIAVSDFLSLLRQHSIVVDSHNYWQAYHSCTCNPMPFVSGLTDEEVLNLVREESRGCDGKDIEYTWSDQLNKGFAKLLAKRCSHRQFTGHGINEENLGYLIWCTYGQTTPLLENVNRRTVPSAGGLYPLRIHLVVRVSCGNFRPGIYGMDQHKDTITLIKKWKASDHEKFAQCFLDDSYLHDYAVCVVISARIERETRKYSNRGYRYALLEVGHSAQNLLIACVEQGLGGVEVGGFTDEKLKEVLSIEVNTFPLTLPHARPGLFDEAEG